MNFNTILEELDKLYDEEKTKKFKPVKSEGKEEPVEEGCANKALKEAADSTVEAGLDELLSSVDAGGTAELAVIICTTAKPYHQIRKWAKSTGKKVFLTTDLEEFNNLSIPADTDILIIDGYHRANPRIQSKLLDAFMADDKRLNILISYKPLDFAIIGKANFVYTEPVNESLKEATDDEIEFAEEPVGIIPEEGEPEESGEEIPEESIDTVEDFVKNFDEYDGKLKLEFKPIVIDGKEYPIKQLLWDDAIEEGKLVAEVIFDIPEEEEVDEVEAADSEIEFAEEPVETLPEEDEE